MIKTEKEIKKGWTVKLNKGFYTNAPNNPLKVEGVVLKVNDGTEYCYKVGWQNGKFNTYRHGELSVVSREVDYNFKVWF